MNVGLTIKQRLDALGLEQKELAAAAGVTESYISQLVARKKLPPLPDRTDIYGRMEKFLKLPLTKLAELAAHERAEELKKRLPDSAVPLYKEVRELVLRKCAAARRAEIRLIFERQPFGELERLITQKLLDVGKKAARQELESESWLRLVAQLTRRSYEQVRVAILELLDADIFNISAENCVSFLDPLIDAWDIDLSNFGIEIVLNRRLASAHLKKLEFVEREVDDTIQEEPGFNEFLKNAAMSGDASAEEIKFLKSLRFREARPTALYYYRELQNLRDPLNFCNASVVPPHKHRDANTVERQMHIHARHSAVQRWAESKSARSRKKKTKTARQLA